MSPTTTSHSNSNGKFLHVDCNTLWKQNIDTSKWCNVPDQTKIKRIERTKPEFFVGLRGKKGVVGTMHDLRSVLEQVPRGRVIQVNQLLHHTTNLYKNKGVEYACPFYGGFWSAELASAERFKLYNKQISMNEVSPFWRIVDSQGRLSPLIPEQKTFLEKEGIRLERYIDKDGDERFKVADLAKHAIML